MLQPPYCLQPSSVVLDLLFQINLEFVLCFIVCLYLVGMLDCVATSVNINAAEMALHGYNLKTPICNCHYKADITSKFAAINRQNFLKKYHDLITIHWMCLFFAHVFPTKPSQHANSSNLSTPHCLIKIYILVMFAEWTILPAHSGVVGSWLVLGGPSLCFPAVWTSGLYHVPTEPVWSPKQDISTGDKKEKMSFSEVFFFNHRGGLRLENVLLYSAVFLSAI